MIAILVSDCRYILKLHLISRLIQPCGAELCPLHIDAHFLSPSHFLSLPSDLTFLNPPLALTLMELWFNSRHNYWHSNEYPDSLWATPNWLSPQQQLNRVLQKYRDGYTQREGETDGQKLITIINKSGPHNLRLVWFGFFAVALTLFQGRRDGCRTDTKDSDDRNS